MAKVFQVDTGGTLTANLLAYYKLEDATDFWSTNNLTNSGVSFVAAKVNNGADCESTESDYLYGGDILDITTGQFSFFCWVKVESFPANGWIVGKDHDTQGREYAFGVDSTSKLNLQVAGVGSIADSNTALSTGTWYNVGVTFDDATNAVTYFLNGVADGTTTNSGALSNVTASFNVGRRSYTGYEGYFDGIIDELGIWGKILSSTEITDLYNSGSGQTMVDQSTATSTNMSMDLLGIQ